jgi:cbb3-type cytochrome oxidase maturation protein
MYIVFILVPVTLLLVVAACWAFFWAAGDGQFDDLDTPAWDVLSDDQVTDKDHDRAA